VQSNDISETLKHINTIEVQNAKLKNIAWTQSHVVHHFKNIRIIDLIEGETENFSEMLFWLNSYDFYKRNGWYCKKLLKKQSELKRIKNKMKKELLLMTTLFSE
jgi:hypothetical protein